MQYLPVKGDLNKAHSVCFFVCLLVSHFFTDLFDFIFFSRLLCIVFVLFKIIHFAFAWNFADLVRVTDAKSSAGSPRKKVVYTVKYDAPSSLAILRAFNDRIKIRDNRGL